MPRKVKRSEGIKTVSRTDRQGNLKSEKTVYKGQDGYKEKTKLKVSPKKDATSKPQATLTTTTKSKGGSKTVIERKGDYDSDYEYVRGNNKTILDRKPRKERKDLKRSAVMMSNIKNPQKMPTLGARKIITEDNSSEKDYLVDKFATNSNDPRFGGGVFSDRKEIQSNLREINNSNEPVNRNPGDRAIRNKKNKRKFDRGV